MIYVDTVGHLVSADINELHKFAHKLGLKREWFQDKRLPHYDLTTAKMRKKAVNMGAQLVDSKAIIKVLKGDSNA